MTGSAPARDAVRVLIVDDNRDFAANLAALAQAQGLLAEVAHDRRSALARARRESFDVAVVDQKLPDGLGTELLAELRATAPDLVALVVTAFVSLDNSIAALNGGASGFLAKDADPEEILGSIARAAENARLRRENRGLRGIQEQILLSIPDFVAIVDERGIVQSVNQSHPAFCPGDPGAAVGRSLTEIAAPCLRRRLDLTTWLEGVRDGRDRREHQIELRDPEGRERFFALRVVPLERSDRPLALLRVADLTDRVVLERQLGESENLAALGRLVSSIAHEIRNPLAGIRALSQLLGRRLEGDDRESAQEILALTDRMHATVSDLLQFARPGARREERLDLDAILGALEAEARRWPAAEGRTIELRSEEERPFPLLAARDRVIGMFGNLLENALHAARDGGRVRIGWRRDGDGAVVSIEDDGPGIDPEAASHLFQPFFTTKTRGTGLGLSIVAKTAASLGGSVDFARSSDLGGACFRVHLPAPAPE